MAKSGRPGYYVVWQGRKPGIYTTWSECELQVKGYSGAKFEKFRDKKDAEKAFYSSADTYLEPVSYKEEKIELPDDYTKVKSISSDAACSGNPGRLEYRLVDTLTKELLYPSSIYPVGTNNIGEFLGLVKALQYIKQHPEYKCIYTDSTTALAWVRNQKIKTNLERNTLTENLWQDIDEALDWLKNQDTLAPIKKWDTEKYGDIPADYNRK